MADEPSASPPPQATPTPRDREGESGGAAPAPRRRAATAVRGYEVAIETALAPALAVGLGAWADSRWGTSPWLILLGTAIGLGAAALRLARYLDRSAEPRGDS